MDVDDALELLSSAFVNPAVRKYAVTRLQQADDEVSDVSLYTVTSHLRCKKKTSFELSLESVCGYSVAKLCYCPILTTGMIKITLYVFYSNNNYYYFHLTAISQVKLEQRTGGR